MSQLPISVLVQTKNEELGMRICLEALGDFAEVIVVDSDSTDRTKAIALECGAQVINFTWDRSYPKKKQWQLDNVPTSHPWILFLDADETPTRELISELRRIFEYGDPDVVAYDIPLDYVFSGVTLKHGHRVSKRCLLLRGANSFPVINDLDLPGMGELEGHYQPLSRGRVARLLTRLNHNDKDPVRTWFDRHNRYSDWEANVRAEPSRRRAIADAKSSQGRVFDRVPFKPLAFFFYSYIARGGFLDRRAGLDYALALSMYYWQIELKYRELKQRPVAEAKNQQPEASR